MSHSPVRILLAVSVAALWALCPPAPAAAAPPPAAVFGGLPGVQHVAISPNGQLLAADRTTDAGTSVEVYDIGAASVRRTIQLEPQNKLRDLNWASDDTLLIDVSFTQSMGGFVDGVRTDEWERTLAVDVERGTVRTMLLDDEDRQLVTGSTLLATRTGRPQIVVMSSWDHAVTRMTGPRDTRLGDDRRDSGWVRAVFDVNTRTGRGKATAIGSPYTQGFVVDPQGQAVARADWDSDRDLYTVLAKRENSWQEIFRLAGDYLDLGGLSPDGGSVLAVGANGTDRSKVWAIALDGSGAKVYFEDAEVEVESLKMDIASGRALGAFLGGTEQQIRYFDPKQEARKKAIHKAFPGRVLSLIDASSDGSRVLVRVEAPTQPRMFYLVDFKSGKADVAGEEYPALTGAELGEVRDIEFAARDGARIPAYLTLPPGRGEKDLPMVVLPHGGPESRDYYAFDWWAQFLATRGYAVLQPQFRGSTGFGTAHRVAGYRQWGGLMQDDVTDGVLAMIKQGIADPARICIAGASYGGYSALAGAAFTPDLYACAISVNGVADLPAMIGYAQRQWGRQSDSLAYWKEHIGPPQDSNVVNRSPARAAASVRAPVLLLHGADDTVVPITQSETMERALVDARKTCSFVRLPGEDHWLSRSTTRTQVLTEMERFLARYLGSN